MSLNYDLTAVKDRDESEMGVAVTDALIWATMGVGMDAITEENKDEFFCRLHIYEQVFGSWISMRGDDGKAEPYNMKYEDVCKHIGLKTNASRLTDAAFKTKIWKELEGRAKGELKEAKAVASKSL